MVLSEVLQAIKEFAAVDVSAMSDDELSEAMVDLQRARYALEAQHARVARRWDVVRPWSSDGARSGAAWLAKRTRAPKAECGGLLHAARRTRAMHHVVTAWEAGEIGHAHVRQLVTVCTARTDHAFFRDEAELVHWARTLSFSDFTKVVAYWYQHADAFAADDDERTRFEERRASFDETISGMWSGAQLFDPISGLIISNELRRLERQLFEADWAEAKERLRHEPTAFELRRTPDQRRADAFVEMAKRSSGAGERPAARPLFSVVLGADALGRLCELESGRVVTADALRRFAGDADIEAVLFEGGDRVIRVSRQRTFSGALRRLIEVRDRSCYHPYCDAVARDCQVDHIVPYAAGGLTSQDNGRLACGHHNRLRHRKRPPPPADDDPAD